MKPNTKVAILIFAAAASAWGCGRKTGVKPPQLVAPVAIAELEAQNGDNGIELSWERPTQYVDGSSMYDLAAFRIERRTGAHPFAVHDQVVVEDRYRFQKIKRFRYLDIAVIWGSTYTYRIFSLTADDNESAPSNQAEIRREVAAANAETPKPSPDRDEAPPP